MTDAGGLQSEGAILAREFGIVAVVGTKDATAKIKAGSTITVDGDTGFVFAAEHGSGPAGALMSDGRGGGGAWSGVAWHLVLSSWGGLMYVYWAHIHMRL